MKPLLIVVIAILAVFGVFGMIQLIAYYSASEMVHRSGFPAITQQDIDDVHRAQQKIEANLAELESHNH